MTNPFQSKRFKEANAKRVLLLKESFKRDLTEEEKQQLTISENVCREYNSAFLAPAFEKLNELEKNIYLLEKNKG